MNTLPEGGATASTMNETTSLKPDPFSELRGLMEAAHLTPLPWKHGNPTGWIWCPSAKGGDRHVADIRGWGYFTGGGLGALGLSDDEALAHQRAVGDLIVAAVNSLGALLDERDRLHEGLRKRGMRIFDIDPVTDALDALTEWKGYSDKFEARALSAEGEVEKLKAALEAVKALAVPVKTPTPNLLVGLLSRIHMLARQALSQEIG